MSSAEARPLRLAHRGDHRRLPENTIAALTAAAALPGCDGVELDVRASADGVPVVIHDASLARVFGRSERAEDLPATALEALGVPTLCAVLAALPPSAFVDVEFKEDAVAASVAAITAARGDPPEAIVLSSFDDVILARAGTLAPDWPRWLNATCLDPTTVERALRLGCAGVAVEWRALEARSIGRARAAGLDVAAWTVRRRPTARRLARLGVAAICVEGAALDPGA